MYNTLYLPTDDLQLVPLLVLLQHECAPFRVDLSSLFRDDARSSAAYRLDRACFSRWSQTLYTNSPVLQMRYPDVAASSLQIADSTHREPNIPR